MEKHYTIPFFIPHRGCPFTCVFCGQKKITGKKRSAPVRGISQTISKYLKTMPLKGAPKEVAFFGGSFTALALKEQASYLRAVQPFIKKGLIKGIRISTRPDFITWKTLSALKKYNVKSIELGVQSSSDDVLKAAKRGHTASDIKKASRLILKHGFTLGHQIMVGLPESTPSSELKTAKMSLRMKASEARIYPVVVIKGTELAGMMRKGRYKPLTESEAIARSAVLVKLFEKNKVRILRCGLHPSPGLLSGKDILGGAFHPAFGQKVQAHIYGKALLNFFKKEKNPHSIKCILFNPADTAYVIGHKRENALSAESLLGKRKVFFSSPSVRPGSMKILYENSSKKIIEKLN